MGTLKQAVDRVAAAKTAIGAAITAKGGTVAAGDGLEEFAADIATIPTGGAVNSCAVLSDRITGSQLAASIEIYSGQVIYSGRITLNNKLTTFNVMNNDIDLSSIYATDTTITDTGRTVNGSTDITIIVHPITNTIEIKNSNTNYILTWFYVMSNLSN